MRTLLAGLAGALLLGGAASAQVLPETSRSEATSTSINNSLVRQGQSRDAAQQQQFEINSLRNPRPAPITPPAVIAPPIAGPAPLTR